MTHNTSVSIILQDIASIHNQFIFNNKVIVEISSISDAGSSNKENTYQETQKTQPEPSLISLILTDGTIAVKAIERIKIPGLSLNVPLGTKMALQNVLVRRGILILEPSNACIL